MGKLDGRVAIVTGGGRGIGRATALRFAAEGAKVVAATRTAAPGQEVVDEIVAGGGEAMLVTLDIGERAAVTALIEQVAARFGRIDIVLHNAAYLTPANLADMPDEVLDKMFDVGVKAIFWLTHDALPWLKKSPAARILVTSSVAGNQRSLPGRVHYGSVKMAVTGFVRGAGLELARLGITVNAMEQIVAMGSEIPIGRAGYPEEIAAGFLFLASDDAAYMTGRTITMDGGNSLGDARGLLTERDG
jgi:3-oxoacyl-[acyl-carrier protein] reductase